MLLLHDLQYIINIPPMLSIARYSRERSLHLLVLRKLAASYQPARKQYSPANTHLPQTLVWELLDEAAASEVNYNRWRFYHNPPCVAARCLSGNQKGIRLTHLSHSCG